MAKIFATNIESKTLNNSNYRKVIYTDKCLQVVLMSIPPKGTIPLEVHKGSQFIRVESGSGSVRSGKSIKVLRDGTAVVIPPGKKHEVRSTGRTPLKLYAVYTPPEHPRGTVQRTQPDDD